MGLDISVYKVVEPKFPIKDEDDFYVLSDFPELSIFSHLSFEKVNSYYDIEESIKSAGFLPEDLIWAGEEYGKDGAIFKYIDLKNPLYEAYKFLNEKWSDAYFENRKDLFESQIFDEFKETHLGTLKSFGYKPEYRFFAKGSEKTYYNLNSAWEFASEMVSVKIKNPPTIGKIEKCITFEEVGYQRKGANKKFYADGMWDSPCVIDAETLKSHWEKYFSYSTPESKGGWGSGVEYHQEDSEMRENFKRNIIDNFVEGETFVVYH